ncbi:MAG: DUF4595 domain-containing protein [Verrucomicrobia bacterium]|nr:DUF4595 domain-containing protein [Cytophagales bacterium]
MKKASMCLLAMVIACAACKKDEEEPGCRFVSKTSDNYTYEYRFDVSDKLTLIQTTTPRNVADFKYTYQDKQVTIDVTYDVDWLKLRYDITLNDQGYALTAQQTIYNRLPDGSFQESVTENHVFTYDSEGYLTEHQWEEFMYPPGKDKLTKSFQKQLTYLDGNPVEIIIEKKEPGLKDRITTIRNQYSTQANPLKIPFLIESSPSGYMKYTYMEILLGKPARHLIRTSELNELGRVDTLIQHTYKFGENGQLSEVASNRLFNSKISFENNCP